MFRSLRSKNYRLYFVGQGLSLIGTWMQHVSVSWLAFRLTESPFMLGAVAFAAQIPTFFLSPLAGVVADRVDRRRYIMAAQALLLGQALLIGILTLTGHMTIQILLGMAVLFGVLNAIDIPLRQSFILEMVDRKEDLGNAIGLNAVLLNVARLIGPSLAGFVIAVYGEGVCFMVNAASFLPLILALSLMKLPAKILKEQEQNFREGLTRGFGYALGHKPIRTVLFALAVVSLCGVPYGVLMPIFASDIFHGDSRLLGFLLAASGVGALLAAVFMSSRKGGPAQLPRLVGLMTALFGLALAAFSMSETLWLSIIFLTVSGFAIMAVNASCNILLQTLTEESMRGRIMSFYVMCFLGLAPIGSFLGGALAQKIGAPLTVRISGALCVLGSIVFSSLARSTQLRSSVPE